MIQWVVCDPATGQVIESLPGLRLESSLPSYVGKGDKVSVSLPVMQRPARWQLACEPNRVLLVAHHDDEPQTVLWAGPIQTLEYGSGSTITMSAIPADESYTYRMLANANNAAQPVFGLVTTAGEIRVYASAIGATVVGISGLSGYSTD